MRKKLILIFGVVMIPIEGWAFRSSGSIANSSKYVKADDSTPTVTSVSYSGNLNAGTIVTITGSNLPIFAPIAPLVWIDVNDPVSTSPKIVGLTSAPAICSAVTWPTQVAESVVTSTIPYGLNTKDLSWTWTTGNGSGANDFAFKFPITTMYEYDKNVLVSTTNSNRTSDNFKPNRAWLLPGQNGGTDWLLAYQPWSGTLVMYFENTADTGQGGLSNDSHFAPNAIPPTVNQWQQDEMTVITRGGNQRDAAGNVDASTFDAIMDYTRNGVCLIHREDSDPGVNANGLQDLLVMNNDATSAGNPVVGNQYHTADIYLTSGICRIMTSTSSTWLASQSSGPFGITPQLDIQIPTGTTSTSSQIQFSFHNSSYTNGQTIYLYVISTNNVANTNGLAMTVGQAQSSGGSGGNQHLNIQGVNLNGIQLSKEEQSDDQEGIFNSLNNPDIDFVYGSVMGEDRLFREHIHAKQRL